MKGFNFDGIVLKDAERVTVFAYTKTETAVTPEQLKTHGHEIALIPDEYMDIVVFFCMGQYYALTGMKWVYQKPKMSVVLLHTVQSYPVEEFEGQRICIQQDYEGK
jgi:hypothetical protein